MSISILGGGAEPNSREEVIVMVMRLLARFEPRNRQSAECDCCGKRRRTVRPAALTPARTDKEGYAYCAECRLNPVHPLDDTFCIVHLSSCGALGHTAYTCDQTNHPKP